MNNKTLILLVCAAIAGLITLEVIERIRDMNDSDTPQDGEVACTMEAKLCPDGSYVGRIPPLCEFASCPTIEDTETPTDIPIDIETHIESKANLIQIHSPKPQEIITSPFTITGEARGSWYFEATFPIVIVDWDGRIIGQGYATAQDDWMTTEFVPFEAIVAFELPQDTPYRRGTLILQKSNASGLPQHDDALEIPIRF